MNIQGIGKDISDSFVDGHLERLSTFLAYTQHLGYTIAEVDIASLGVIINGRLLPQRIERVKSVLARYPLRFTVHGPSRTNLAYSSDPDLEQAVLAASIEFCHDIQAGTLVYHSGLQALNAARTGLADLPDERQLAQGAEREVAALRDLAPIAADAGVTVAIENGDPHLWEYALLKQHRRPARALSDYHGRLRVAPIVAQLEAVNHPNIGMTLDLGHLYLASHALDDDYLDAITQAAPWVRHLHINDNFGKLDSGHEEERTRLPYGEADLHLPPGWGAIPYADAFARLDVYQGDIILEIKELYWDHFGDALANMRQILTAAGHTVQ